MSTEDDLLVLFTRRDCEFCRQAIELVNRSSGARFAIYEVFQSRIEGKLQLRRLGEQIADIPVLIDANKIPAVPCLYDPLLDEYVGGIDDIDKYLEDSGLLDD